MKIVSEAADSLDLDHVKRYCLVEHDLDDEVLNGFIAASLRLCEEITHRHFLSRTYEATIYEHEILLDSTLKLSLPVAPELVEITLTDGSSHPVRDCDIYYCSGTIKVDLTHVDLTSSIQTVIAKTGHDPIDSLIIQARLSIIEEWYTMRGETGKGVNTAQLPTGAIKTILPILGDVAI